PAVHAGVRSARRAEHRRGPRRGGGQARVLVGLPGAWRVVRGPAALLGVVGAALAYVLIAPELPELHPPELSALVAGRVGLTFVVAIIAGLVAVADVPIALVPALIGAGLLVAALNVNDAAAAATPFEAVLFGCAGVAFAVVFDMPAMAVALPLFVAVID